VPVLSARPHLQGLALFAASLTLALVFAATSRAEDATLTADATPVADAGPAAPTSTAEGSPPTPTSEPTPASDSGEASDAPGTIDPGATPGAVTTDDPGAPVPGGAADGASSGNPSGPTPDSPGGTAVPGDTPGSTADPGPTAPTDPGPLPPGDQVPVTDPPTGPEPGQAPTTTPSVPAHAHVSTDFAAGVSPDGFPIGGSVPVSDEFVAGVLGGSRSSAPPLNDPSSRTGRVTAALGSGGAPGQPSLPTDSPGPSAPASAPAGSGGPPGGGFFFSGFAALGAAVCFGLTGRSTKRLITSVAAWEPVAFVSLPERPG
jgi:hypothetical protein